MPNNAETMRLNRAALKKQERRTLYAANTSILDDFIGDTETLTTRELCELLHIRADTTMRNVMRYHRDELEADGYNPVGDPAGGGTFNRRAIIRVAMMVRKPTSQIAGKIAEAAGARYERIAFGDGNNGAHASRCSSIIDRAAAVAVAVHDEDPAEVWAELNGLDRYTLQGVVVTLAAMVPVDQPHKTLLQWVGQLSSSNAAGMTKLIPSRRSATGLPLSLVDDGAVA